MDRFLRPYRFTIDAANQADEQDWAHWKKTFDNFLSALSPLDLTEEKKLKLLVNHVSSDVFNFISGCNNYLEAVYTLESLFSKPRNEIYARHRLATRRQLVGESLEHFLQALHELSKDCTFSSVTAKQNKNDYLRDCFIKGVCSDATRQRLLQNSKLSVDEALNQARLYEASQLPQPDSEPLQAALSSTPPTDPGVLVLAPEEILTRSRSRSQTRSRSRSRSLSNPYSPTTIDGVSVAAPDEYPKCYLCGNIFQGHTICPATNVVCDSCGKRDSYSTCQSGTGRKSLLNSDCNSTDPSEHCIPCEKAIRCPILVNGIAMDALIDVCKSISFIRTSVVSKYNFQHTSCISTAIGVDQSFHADVCSGNCFVDIDMSCRTLPNIILHVIDNISDDVVLGHDVLCKYSSVQLTPNDLAPPLKLCCLTTSSVSPISLFMSLENERVFEDFNIQTSGTLKRHSCVISELTEDEIKRLTREEIIESSTSPWNARVRYTYTDKKRAMIIDYSQTINKFTFLDPHQLPTVEEIVKKISEYEFFSSIDLHNAKLRIPIAIEDRPYTAFEVRCKLYQFKVIPFGIKNGIAGYQRIVDAIIESEDLQDTFAFLDEVVICGRYRAEHDLNVQKFLKAAKKFNINIENNMCKFLTQFVTIHGYQISKDDIQPDPERLKLLKHLPFTATKNILEGIVGMFTYYSKWIANFSEKIRPLVEGQSTPEAMAAFESLKLDVANAVVSAVQRNALESNASSATVSVAMSSPEQGDYFKEIDEKRVTKVIKSLKKWTLFTWSLKGEAKI